MLIADADVPDQVIQALQAVRFEIIRAKELGIPIDDDRPLMEGVRERNGVLTTKDTGIPSQAYLYQYAQICPKWADSSGFTMEKISPERLAGNGSSYS
ncbi:MAG: hypothetical protein Q8O86_01980 [Dehalococcoidia bacterium]|nr:hypothetical protein [Dehalococcoidia bacterium]